MYGIGAGLGRWTETTISPALLEVTTRGVQLHVGLQDAEVRQIEVRIDDRSERRRRPATLLAPFGAAIQHPDSLMLVWMRQFDLLRRTARAPEIRIDGRTASTGRLPGAWLHRRLLIKYASDLAVVRLNAQHRVTLRRGHPSAGSLELDASWTRINALTAEAGAHRARLELVPPLPSTDQLRPGVTIAGSWRLGIDTSNRVVGGQWTARRDSERVALALDVTQGWRSSHLPLLMRLVTTIAPVFRTWPTTYRWRGSVQLVGGAVMSAEWLRSGDERGASYRGLTGTDGEARGTAPQ